MIASAPTAVALQRLDRDRALSALLGLVVSESGLSADAETDIRIVLRRHVERLLALADAAISAQHEMEAHDARIDRHVRTHQECIRNRRCRTYQDLQRRRGDLQRAADSQRRALLGGSW